MLLNLRLYVPPSLVAPVQQLLGSDRRVAGLAVLPGASRVPPGDVILVDVPREAASEILDALEDLGLGDVGSVTVTEVEGAPFRGAERAEQAAPGSPDDGVLWRLVQEQAEADSRGSWSFYTFLTVAVALAAIAVITDSSVLVVGAMVVGPEFAAIAAAATGIVLGQLDITRRAIWLLVRSFTAAVLVVMVLALLARTVGWVTPGMVTHARPLTGFIWHPDHWSFVVAVMAGVAGVISLTAGKASALVGVFISVTTVPALGNLALGLAVWSPAEVRGSLLQLGLNLLGLVLAGVATLSVQRLGSRLPNGRRRGSEGRRRLPPRAPRR
jgi:uncharacterized hydrophobic protein (TIGR00271 family)